MGHPVGETTAADMLSEFMAAWNAHDLDALMAMMTEDCVFHASAGPTAAGRTSVGPAAVRAAYAEIFEAFPDARWTDARHGGVGERGWSEWTFTGTGTDGRSVKVRGCDLFVLRDDRIAVKDSFRKSVTPDPSSPPAAGSS